MRDRFFPNVLGCDWAIYVRHAKAVPLTEDYEDLVVVRDAFNGWASAGRTSFFEGGPFIAVAASYDEAIRFEKAVVNLIREHDLYVTVSLVQRDAEGRWDEIESEATSVSDQEIEEELRAFVAEGEDDDDQDPRLPAIG